LSLIARAAGGGDGGVKAKLGRTQGSPKGKIPLNPVSHKDELSVVSGQFSVGDWVPEEFASAINAGEGRAAQAV
jgi:hypothetical protein